MRARSKPNSQLIRNSTEKITLPSGRTVHVPKCRTEFTKWDGDLVPTYGGKALLKLRGKPVFAELMVLGLLREQGWFGVWVDSYQGKFRDGMPHESQPVDTPIVRALCFRKYAQKLGAEAAVLTCSFGAGESSVLSN